MSKTYRKFPLRTTFVAPFVLQIVAAVGLVGYLSYWNGQKAVANLTNQLMEQVSERVTQRLTTYLETPQQVNRLSADAVRLRQLDLQNLPAVERHLVTQLQQFTSVSSVQVGSIYKTFQQVTHQERWTLARSSATNPETIEKYDLNPTTGQTQRLGTSQLQVRNSSWYQAALFARKPIWSQLSRLGDSPDLSLTATLPVYDEQGQELAVFSASVFLSSIEQFLSSLNLGRSSKAIVIERNGWTIASSHTGTSNQPQRINIVNSPEPSIQMAGQSLIQSFGGFTQINQAQQLSFISQGERQFLRVVPFRDQQGLDWLILVVVPESDFMTQINANTRNTIGLTLAALGIAIAVGILTARLVTNPVLRLTEAAKELASGNLDRRVDTSDLFEIAELDTLEHSFNGMAAQLKESFETLEDKVKERTAELASANDEIIALNEKLQQDNLRLGAEIDIARQMQQMILPNDDELNIEGLDIAGYMEPADEVGGDYYDVLHTDGIVTLGIGDVTGHGLESGILMLMAQTSVRTLQEIREVDPVRFLDVLNRTLYKNVQRMNSEKSLTLALLNYSEGRVSISGQHEETIVVRKGGEIERIDTMDLGFPIALDYDIADFISHVSIELQPGDGVVLYTDGIPEAYNIQKQQYGIERMCEVLGENWHLSAQAIEQALIADVRRHIGTQKVFDDITLLVLKRTEVAVEQDSQL